MKKIKRENTIKRTGIFILSLALIISMLAPMAFANAEGEKMLIPMGSTVGIQMYTDGVMVVGLSATEDGEGISPAAQAGILQGDVIVQMGDDKIGSADDFRQAVEKLDGSPISIKVKRESETLEMSVQPNLTNGKPELGIWLRDTIAGIGTLTYYDPQTGGYGGLGHSISDMESGAIIPIARGEIMKSTVTDVIKGAVGKPGEICGSFDLSGVCGSIRRNTDSGIFGELNLIPPTAQKAIPMGTEADITLGKATILANVYGSEVAEYEIEIVRVYRDDESNRSMMLKVTDSELLERTGGIVQGMSGSPIIQDGKLVGAVTHVLVNDPTKGYGIFVENMLEAAA